MGASPSSEYRHGLSETQGLLVGALRGQRIEDVRHCKDAGHLRDVAAPAAFDVPGPVIALVVADHHRGGIAQPRGAAHDVTPVPDVLLHLLELLLREVAGLEQDAVPDADLAHIVEERTLDERAHLVVGEARLLTETDGIDGDPVVVDVRVAVPLGYGAAEHVEDLHVGVQEVVGETRDPPQEAGDHRVEQQGGEQHDERRDERDHGRLEARPCQDRGADGVHPLRVAHVLTTAVLEGAGQVDDGGAVHPRDLLPGPAFLQR